MYREWIKYWSYVPGDVRSTLATLHEILPSDCFKTNDGKDLSLMNWIRAAVDQGLITENERLRIVSGVAPNL